MMTSTSTHTSGPRSAGSQALRAAGRQLLATAGNQVLKAAVDRAVGQVDQVAGRLDAVASGDRSKRPANRKPPRRSAEQRERLSTSQVKVKQVKVKVGAAFNLVVQQALRLLQLIQRLARQLLAALSQFFHRGDEDGTPSEETETQGVDRTAPRRQVDKAERTNARRSSGQPPAAGQPARSPQAPRRQGPRPASREAGGAPRRVGGDRPVRAVRND
jgi:hypothetical protein